MQVSQLDASRDDWLIDPVMRREAYSTDHRCTAPRVEE